MEVIDPGHVYSLQHLDTKQGGVVPFNILTFVKREGDKYPGNVGHHPGTTTQEVLRALIDRTKYVQTQLPCAENKNLLYHLRMSLFFLEKRVHRIRGYGELNIGPEGIEDISTCDICGHIYCKEDHDEKEEVTDNTT